MYWRGGCIPSRQFFTTTKHLEIILILLISVSNLFAQASFGPQLGLQYLTKAGGANCDSISVRNQSGGGGPWISLGFFFSVT